MREPMNIAHPRITPAWISSEARTAAFNDDKISFSSRFPAGNGHSFQRLDRMHYAFCSRVGAQPYSYRFYFRIDGGIAPELRLRVVDFKMADPVNPEDPGREYAAMISYDDENWTALSPGQIRIIPDGDGRAYAVEYHLFPEKYPVWIASPLPYRLKDLNAFLDYVSAGKDVKATSLGSSFCGLDIPFIDLPAADNGESFKLFVIGGQHPSETAGIMAVEGMVRELLENANIRRSITLYAVPLLNMDGWIMGRTNDDCADESGRNLDRDWKDFKSLETKQAFQSIRRVRPDLLIDCHNGRGWDRHRFQDAYGDDYLPGFLEALRMKFEKAGEGCLIMKTTIPDTILSHESVRRNYARAAFVFENVLTKSPSRERYLRAGRLLMRAVAELVWQMFCVAKPVKTFMGK